MMATPLHAEGSIDREDAHVLSLDSQNHPASAVPNENRLGGRRIGDRSPARKGGSPIAPRGRILRRSETAATGNRPCRVSTLLQRAPSAAGIHIDYAEELNPQQLAAVTASPGPLLVIAGAGSGKTRTLTYRVAYLLENGVDPRNILLLTFTNKAARQMLDRVANLLPVDASGLWGGTFHSIGNRMLRRHGSVLGYSERVHDSRSRRSEGFDRYRGRGIGD